MCCSVMCSSVGSNPLLQLHRRALQWIKTKCMRPIIWALSWSRPLLFTLPRHHLIVSSLTWNYLFSHFITMDEAQLCCGLFPQTPFFVRTHHVPAVCHAAEYCTLLPCSWEKTGWLGCLWSIILISAHLFLSFLFRRKRIAYKLFLMAIPSYNIEINR